MKGTQTSIPSPKRVLEARDRRGLWLFRISLFLSASLLAAGIVIFEFPSDMARQEFEIGEPASRTFFAPFEVSYVNEPATEEIRKGKVSATPHLFDLQTEATTEIKNQIALLFNALAATAAPAVSPVQPSLPFEIPQDLVRVLAYPKNFQEAQNAIGLLQEKMATEGVLDPNVKEALLQAGYTEIAVWNKETKAEKNVALQTVMTPAELDGVIEKTVAPEILKNRELKNAISNIAKAVVRINLIENGNETNNRQKKIAASVEPVMERIKKSELIMQRGILITAESRERMVQVQKKLATHKALNKFYGAALLTVIIYFFSFFYLWFFEKRVFASRKLLVLIHIVYLGNLAIDKAFAIWPGSSYYLMPTALSSVLTALLINPRIGFLSAGIMAVLIGPMTGFAPEAVLMTLIASTAGTFASLQLRKRIQFLRLGLGVGLAAFFVLLVYKLFQEYSFVESFQMASPGLVKGLLVTMPLSFVFLTLLEWAFGLTTDITLLELSDLNHPLLKRMIIEAPGTYHHSLVVSTLAEAACETIGANALLARVGCYFHDIGKIARAEFFTENSQQKNQHENLSPTQSCLIIMNHVRDGVALGRKYKLKEHILKFIPEHQGTGVIYYFYRKALDNAKPGQMINPEDFRYPGPKPQSRETAVALLSDSVEAASRSLKEFSPESIRQLVRKIINDKFIDGQLDECDLTLRDLHKIQESYVRNLMAIFHTRVQYPAAKQEAGRPDLFADKQFSKFRIESEEQHTD